METHEDYKQTVSASEREKVIVRTSIIGIGANVLLSGVKAFIGLITGSIAVVLDAVNNLSDAISSIITVIGTKLAGKAPDRKHPYGHGRAEYITQMIVAAIVLYAGVTAFVESIKKIIHPEEADYSTVSLIIIAAAVAVKLLLGLFVRRQGKKVHSGALVASGTDAFFDAILSTSVLASAIIFLTTGLSLEAWVGIVISVFIIKSGVEMVKDAIDEIIGNRVSGELSGKIKETVSEEEHVMGVYDLFLNNYGPDKYTGSLHVEVPGDLTASEIDTLTRRIGEKVYLETGVILTAVGVYSANLGDEKAEQARAKVREIVMTHDYVLQLHGFYLNEETKRMSFDIILDFACPDRESLYKHIKEEVQEAFPEYQLTVTLDIDISD